MAINIRETFQVKAPIEVVWQFLTEPRQVVVCVPGAELQEVANDNTFRGSIKVKLGPISTSYTGQVKLTRVDEKEHGVQMVAEGLERGGGVASGTMFSRLRALPNGQTEIEADLTAEVSGRIAQFGRGMIQDVSRQLFQQFAACVKERLEGSPEVAQTGESALQGKEAIPIVSLVMKAASSALRRFFRRLFGRVASH